MNIDDMRKLEDNWDSYGAVPINPKAIEIANRIKSVLTEFDAVPCPDGGVQLERHANGYSVEVEISVYIDRNTGDLMNQMEQQAKQEQREKDAILAENICHGIPVCGIENWEIAGIIAKAIREE